MQNLHAQYKYLPCPQIIKKKAIALTIRSHSAQTPSIKIQISSGLIPSDRNLQYLKWKTQSALDH